MEITSETGWEGFRLLRKSKLIERESTFILMERAYALANELGHSVYDCLYLALAEQEAATLVTADRKFYERVKAGTYANLIAWVEEPPREG